MNHIIPTRPTLDVVLPQALHTNERMLHTKMERSDIKSIFFSSFFRTLLLIAAVVATVSLAKINLFSLVFVSGPSMQPTLNSGDVIFCQRVWDTTALQEGDIVVFEHEGLNLIKRVDRILDDGDRFWMLGDNRENSNDSRSFGPVDAADIKYRKVGAIIPLWLFIAAFVSVFGTLGYLMYRCNRRLKNEDSKGDDIQ